jgi:FkbM family methyltransferase
MAAGGDLHCARAAMNDDRERELDSVPESGLDEESYVKKQFRLLLYRLDRLGHRRGRLQGLFAQSLLERTIAVDTPRGSLSFVPLGKGAAGRGLSILTKQPATLEWIDAFQPNGVLWDVGANVGLYTLYAALRGDTKVVAFEPAAVNYFLLAANCEVNGFQDRVDCLLAGLGRAHAIERLEVSQFAPAQSFSFREKRVDYGGRQAALVLSIDELVEDYGLACPNYIKIDVPALTEAIIDGGRRTLSRPEVRSVHVEIAEGSKTGRLISRALTALGFVAAERARHGGSTDVTFIRPAVE